MVFPSSCASAELTSRMEEIDVIASNKVLSKIHDGHGERLFAVVVRGMFADVPNQLTDLLKFSSQSGISRFSRLTFNSLFILRLKHPNITLR